MTGAEAASPTQPPQAERITTLVPDPPNPPSGNRDPARRLRVGRGHPFAETSMGGKLQIGVLRRRGLRTSLVEPYSGEERLVSVIDELMVQYAVVTGVATVSLLTIDPTSGEDNGIRRLELVGGGEVSPVAAAAGRRPY